MDREIRTGESCLARLFNGGGLSEDGGIVPVVAPRQQAIQFQAGGSYQGQHPIAPDMGEPQRNIRSMVIYSVFVNVDEGAVNDWKAWMMRQHIPDVMNTGCFVSCDFGQVVFPPPDDERVSFRVDYRCKSEGELDEYQRQHAPRLQSEHAARYSGRFVASRSVILCTQTWPARAE